MKLIAEGPIQHRKDIVDGLEDAPVASIGMLAGQNFGMQLVPVHG